MILALLAELPAAAAAATAGLAGSSSCFLTTAGEAAAAAADMARFRFAASGVVVTSTALRAGAAITDGSWKLSRDGTVPGTGSNLGTGSQPPEPEPNRFRTGSNNLLAEDDSKQNQ